MRGLLTAISVLALAAVSAVACAATPEPVWSYDGLHPDLAHKVMHAKETAVSGQPLEESERVKVAIRAKPGQGGEEIARWLDDNWFHFTLGYVFGEPGPGFRKWFGIGPDGENTFHASVPILLLPELSWVQGVDYIAEEPPVNDDRGR